MFHVVLYQPEIPPNTGNIIRLCANTRCTLHLIEPLGFQLSEKALKRAGLDYHDLVRVFRYPDLTTCLRQWEKKRCFALTTKGETCYTQVSLALGDVFVLGSESKGLPEAVLAKFPKSHRLTLPHHTVGRSLNLANVAAVMVYEAWRQNHFEGWAQGTLFL